MKVGIIGTGTMGQIHTKNLSSIPGIKISAIFSSQEEEAAQMAATYHAEHIRSKDDLFNRTQLDIVFVCTPTPSHAEYALPFIEAGKHVFLEKPIARTLGEGQQIIQATQRATGKFFVGHVVRFSHDYVHIKKLMDDGMVGKVGVIRTDRRARFPRGIDNWFSDSEKSGGVILDMIIHDIDYLRWCFGEVKQVYANNLMYRSHKNKDYALIIMRFKNGIIAHLEGSWTYEGEFHTAIEIAGDKGLINFNSLNTSPINLFKNRDVNNQERVAVPKPPVKYDPYFLEDQYFIDCIRKNVTPCIGAQDGYNALSIALAALESAQTGKLVKM